MSKNLSVNVTSEIGKLNSVIVHTPGQEVANMTPANAEKALYSDILNLPISQKEHGHFEAVLKMVSKTYQLKDLLSDILKEEEVKSDLLKAIYFNVDSERVIQQLMAMETGILSSKIIEGLEIERNSLTSYLDKKRFTIQPLHNFFFMRDASISINNDVLISRMMGKVRRPETEIMKAIFKHHLDFGVNTIEAPYNWRNQQAFIEGGDVHIAREDILLIGMGARTNSKAIDSLIDYYKQKRIDKHFIIQELPLQPESFIHLDMVFTLLDKDKCMVYEPVILQQNGLRCIHISIKDGKIDFIEDRKNIIVALAKLDMPLTPVICGGQDEWNMEREQWHSGANFFSFAPGKVLGYARNVHTVDQMNNAGFEILKATDVIEEKDHPNNYSKCFITVEGSELARGGGGARCMTMPLNRNSVDW